MKDLNIGNIIINDDIVEEIKELQERGYAAAYQGVCIEIIEAITRADDYKTAEERMNLIREILAMRDSFQAFFLPKGGTNE